MAANRSEPLETSPSSTAAYRRYQTGSDPGCLVLRRHGAGPAALVVPFVSGVHAGEESSADRKGDCREPVPAAPAMQRLKQPLFSALRRLAVMKPVRLPQAERRTVFCPATALDSRGVTLTPSGGGAERADISILSSCPASFLPACPVQLPLQRRHQQPLRETCPLMRRPAERPLAPFRRREGDVRVLAGTASDGTVPSSGPPGSW